MISPSDLFAEKVRPRCSGCGQEIDPDTCWCGQPQGEHDSHMFVPMGCDCFRDKGYNEAGVTDI